MARLPVREHRKQRAAAGPDLAGLEPFVANYRIEERHSTETWFEEWGTNWKSLVENFMEGYHLSVTHATTL
ncbi:MAG: SRPBCC family protein, partial [Candidatus Puniceispirillaceae bacterium]